MLMHLGIWKMAAAFIIWLLTLIAGLLPAHFSKSKVHLLHKGDAFARGVFLSAALLHMLPDAESSFQTALPNIHYPLAAFVLVMAFLMLFFMERSVIFFMQKNNRSLEIKFFTPYMVILLLSVHAVIEGAAIGINSSLASAMIIFFAVFAHKGSESFALSSTLHTHHLPATRIKKTVILFSLATPVGIIAATLINQLFICSSAKVAEATFNAFAAGTFLYLGTVHSEAEPDAIDCHDELWMIILGAMLMALVAIWI